jgi:AraC-like DNA-binding protein
VNRDLQLLGDAGWRTSRSACRAGRLRSSAPRSTTTSTSASRSWAYCRRCFTCPPIRVAGRDVAAIVELLAMEVSARRPGSRAAAARLFDALLIAAIRHRLDRQADGEAPSWLRAPRDLAAVHERPAEPWTVGVARTPVFVSHATLARRFAEVVGEPPLRYLARWRMHLAAHQLKYSTDTRRVSTNPGRFTRSTSVPGWSPIGRRSIFGR